MGNRAVMTIRYERMVGGYILVVERADSDFTSANGEIDANVSGFLILRQGIRQNLLRNITLYIHLHRHHRIYSPAPPPPRDRGILSWSMHQSQNNVVERRIEANQKWRGIPGECGGTRRDRPGPDLGGPKARFVCWL